MKTIVKRLEHLEHARRTQIAAASTFDARSMLLEKLNGAAVRLRAGGNWPPEPRPTVEEMKPKAHCVRPGVAYCLAGKVDEPERVSSRLCLLIQARKSEAVALAAS